MSRALAVRCRVTSPTCSSGPCFVFTELFTQSTKAAATVTDQAEAELAST